MKTKMTNYETITRLYFDDDFIIEIVPTEETNKMNGDTYMVDEFWVYKKDFPQKMHMFGVLSGNYGMYESAEELAAENAEEYIAHYIVDYLDEEDIDDLLEKHPELEYYI